MRTHSTKYLIAICTFGAAAVVSVSVVRGQSCPVVTAPRSLNTNSGTDSGDDENPQTATDGLGNWIAVWDSRESLGDSIGTDWDILFAISTDSGFTWTAPAPLNTNAATDTGPDRLPQIATDGAGTWIVAWQSQDDLSGSIGTDYDILYARSVDNGANWSAPAMLNSNADTDSGSDELPQITTDNGGTWLVAWRSNENLGGSIGTDDDIFFSRSTNNGIDWSAPAVLNTNADTDSGNDGASYVGVQIAADGSGNWVAVWPSDEDLGPGAGADKDIFVATSSDYGASWSAPATLNDYAASDTEWDGIPEIITDGAGNWIAAWETQEDLWGSIGTDNDLVYSRSTNNGADWTAAAVLNTNAYTDTDSDDFRPQFATDGAGNWIVTWHSDNDLGTTIGADLDMLMARSTDDGVSWSDPAVLNTNAAADGSADDGGWFAAAHITTDHMGHWVAVWESEDVILGGGSDNDIMVAHLLLDDSDCNTNATPDTCEFVCPGEGTCPTSVDLFVSCDGTPTAFLWDQPVCSDGMPLDCTCTPIDDSPACDAAWLGYHGGYFSSGTYQFDCSAADCLDAPISCSWTVSTHTQLDVYIELSPLAAESFTRCIEFEMYTDCITEPIAFQTSMEFGLPSNFAGTTSEILDIPVAADPYGCFAVRDPVHTLLAAEMASCIGGIYQQTFTGDPVFGGNRLVAGNLDGNSGKSGSPHVIDIYDLGIFLSQILSNLPADTACNDDPHADINGDGAVDTLDYTFIALNYLDSSMLDACCPGGGAPGPVGSRVPPSSAPDETALPRDEDGFLVGAAAAGQQIAMLELRPPLQQADVGDTIDVGLYAVSDGDPDNVGAIDAVLSWNPEQLELQGYIDDGAYTWQYSGFFDDCNLDGLNSPCSGLPANDGDALYIALMQLGGPPAVVAPEGTLITTFSFEVIGGGVAQVNLHADAATYSASRIVSGDMPGTIVSRLIGPPAQTVAAMVFVDAGAAGANDGTGWEDAFTSLQDALAAVAASGGTINEIWVAAGTYRPDEGLGMTAGDRTATFQLLNDVAIYGGFGGWETDLDQRNIDANETTLSGDLDDDDTPVACTQDSPDCDAYGRLCPASGFCIIANNNTENSYHVVTGSGTDATAVLDGFTITAGNASSTSPPDDRGAAMYNSSGDPALANCIFRSNLALFAGGGMYNTYSSPALTNCVFSENSATTWGGGGMANLTWAFPVLTGCTFHRNWGSAGGGMWSKDASAPILNGCTFSENSAMNGGAMYNEGYAQNASLTACSFTGNSAGQGGGMFNNDSCPTVNSCSFTGNSADWGGGMRNINNNTIPVVINSSFIGNSAGSGGGGICNTHHSSPILIDCSLSGNSSGGDGGGISNNQSDPAVVNCTFTGNSANTTGGGMSNSITEGDGPTVTNSILWGNVDDAEGNTGGPYTDETAQINDGLSYSESIVRYSLIQGLDTFAGNGNKDGNPLFVDADGPDNLVGTEDDDLRLSPGSAAIDAADSTAVPADSADLDDDGDTDEPIPYDLDGMPRFLDDPNTPDTGVPGSPVVDMGAYEYFPDCNSNGVPDVCDIDCIGLSGDCAAFECGRSADCQPDGIPDECDIAECAGDPACRDCNVNDVPDWCDINVAATSADVDLDGVPDECVDFTGGCTTPGEEDYWTCFDNWDLPGDEYPDDDDSAAGTAAILDSGDDAFLDEDVTVPVVVVGEGALLRITQTDVEGNLFFSDPVGVGDATLKIQGTLTIGSDRTIGVPDAGQGRVSPDVMIESSGVYMAASGTVASASRTSASGALSATDVIVGSGASMNLEDVMSVSASGDVLLDGLIQVDGAATVDVTGQLTVGQGGVYRATSPPAGEVSASLTAAGIDLTIEGCSRPCGNGGLMELSGTMTVTTDGLAVDGANACEECPLYCGVVAGGYTPPIKRITDRSSLTNTGNMFLSGPAGLEVTSSQPVAIGGDFDNRSTRPDCFWCSNGIFLMDGASPQTFEVAAEDIGPLPNIEAAQFVIGSLTVASGGQVTFADDFDNSQSGQRPCTEAVYVKTLTLEAGSHITIDNCRVYFETLNIDPTAGYSERGCGKLRFLHSPDPPVEEPNATPKGRSISLVIPQPVPASAAEEMAIRVHLTRLHHPAAPPNAPSFATYEGKDRYVNAIKMCRGGTEPGTVACDAQAECTARGLGGTCEQMHTCIGGAEPGGVLCGSQQVCDDRGLGGTCQPSLTCPDSEVYGTTFRCAKLGCDPDYRDWATLLNRELLHVLGPAVVPSSRYDAALVPVSCQGNETSCTALSNDLTILSDLWGNVDDDPQLNVLDVAEVVDKVKEMPGALGKPRTQLQPDSPDPFANVNVLDVANAVDGLKDKPYPFHGPCTDACPGEEACP